MDRADDRGGRSLLIRAVAPGIVLWAFIVAVGLTITPPGIAVKTPELRINIALEGARTDGWNAVTSIWSQLGSTAIVIGVGIVVAALVLVRTRNWRLAAVPLLAILLQGLIFVIAAGVVDRPRPTVEKLDALPPTASYPSGHVGGSSALYGTFVLLAMHFRQFLLRWMTMVLCLLVPLLVAFSRLYRGMHHVTDIGAGFLNGITCAFLAYWWYDSRERGPAGRG